MRTSILSFNDLIESRVREALLSGWHRIHKYMIVRHPHGVIEVFVLPLIAPSHDHELARLIKPPRLDLFDDVPCVTVEIYQIGIWDDFVDSTKGEIIRKSFVQPLPLLDA